MQFAPAASQVPVNTIPYCGKRSNKRGRPFILRCLSALATEARRQEVINRELLPSTGSMLTDSQRVCGKNHRAEFVEGSG